MWAIIICLNASAAYAVSSPLSTAAQRLAFSNEEMSTSSVRKQLRTRSNTALKSIRSSDGGIIDCILLTKQPAFEHPLLKHHKLQRAPTAYPHRSVLSHTQHSQTKVSQFWHENGSCPNGTIPVQRATSDDNLRGSGKGVYRPKFYGAPQDTKPNVIQGVLHEHSIGFTTESNAYYGTQAAFNLWDPMVEQSNEFSLSQLWLTAGSYQTNDLNTIEAGWHVDPSLYSGDSNPRLFVYWTSDAYVNTGCYNLMCPGFVQTSNTIAVGGALNSPISVENGDQYTLTFLVFKDQAQGNWWLQLNGENVGYWPDSIFTHLSESATSVQWGGEIVNRETNGQHTATQMGSGQFAEAGYQDAAYIRNLEWVDGANTLQKVANLQLTAENVTCYNISPGITDPTWGTNFFFGGPGRNPNCP